MAIRRFSCTVRRESECLVEIDDQVINAEWLAEFEKSFYVMELGVESVARDLASYMMHSPDAPFFEGFGYVPRNSKLSIYAPEGAQLAPGLNIITVGDESFDIESYELPDKGVA